MGYTTLYRRYRPQRWDEIVGQQAVTVTLRHALQAGKVGHAYLFSGPRGSGKTTTAKLLAKAVNCTAVSEGEPCNKCIACTEINQGSSLDVLEIDAASHRGIDDVRELQERIKYAPARSAYKVYIIDEIHMLTSEAFNALLKTLEEPPAHVIFILATTDVQKVPATITSRCQRFAFRPLTPEEIAGQLVGIAGREGVQVTSVALAILARLAGGSLRDALSMLDQCLLYNTDLVDEKAVTDVLGVVPETWLVELARALDSRQVPAVLKLLDQALREGKPAGQLLADTLAWVRDLLVLRLCPQEQGLVAISEAARQEMECCTNLSVPFLMQVAGALQEAQANVRWHGQPQLVLELAFFKSLLGGGEAPAAPVVASVDHGSVKMPAGPPANAEGCSPKAGKSQKDAGAALEEEVSNRLVPPQQQPSSGSPVTLETVRQKWPQILEAARRLRVTLYAVLVEASPVGLEGDQLVLGFTPDRSFHRQRMEQAGNLDVAARAVEQVTGRKFRVKCTELSAVATETAAAAADPVAAAARLFEGRVIDLEQRGD